MTNKGCTYFEQPVIVSINEQSICGMVLHSKYEEHRFALDFGIRITSELVSVPVFSLCAANTHVEIPRIFKGGKKLVSENWTLKHD